MTGQTSEEDRDGQVRQKLRGIWLEVLTVPDGQEDATFFELNGDSVSAVRLVSRIEEEFDVMVDVGDIFEDDPTLPALADRVLRRAASPAHG